MLPVAVTQALAGAHIGPWSLPARSANVACSETVGRCLDHPVGAGVSRLDGTNHPKNALTFRQLLLHHGRKTCR